MLQLVDENVKKESYEEEVDFTKLLKRIKKTRASRIEASKRLRKKHNYLEKVSYFYSLVVLVLSIWFLNQTGGSGETATKLLLVLSLSLTFFTMFLNIRNYKERAGNFEENYQHLDVLLNKIDRKKVNDELNHEILKEFHREFEKLNVGKENHLNIDYYKSSQKNRKKFKNKILIERLKEVIINILVAIYPLLLLLIIKLVWHNC